MKLKAFTSPMSPEEKPLYIGIQQGLNGVVIHLVDEKGKHITGGNLLTIVEDGVYLQPAIDPKFGLKLDSTGRLKLIK